MTAKGMVRSVAVGLGAVVLWGVPITGAQARGYHPNPPRHAPAPPQDGSGTQGHGSKPEQASPAGPTATPEGCFRRYDDRCQRARAERSQRPGN